MERYKQMIDYGRIGMIAAGRWWLRSPGDYSYGAALVRDVGAVYKDGDYSYGAALVRDVGDVYEDGDYSYGAALVRDVGDVYEDGGSVVIGTVSVRPAFWLNL